MGHDVEPDRRDPSRRIARPRRLNLRPPVEQKAMQARRRFDQIAPPVVVEPKEVPSR
jgi:hypothetical protein